MFHHSRLVVRESYGQASLGSLPSPNPRELGLRTVARLVAAGRIARFIFVDGCSEEHGGPEEFDSDRGSSASLFSRVRRLIEKGGQRKSDERTRVAPPTPLRVTGICKSIYL